MKSKPERMQDVSVLEIQDANSVGTGDFSIPFIDGDSIQFLATYNAEPDQHSITGLSGATAVPARSYAIKLKIVDSVSADDDGTGNGSTVVPANANVLVNDVGSGTGASQVQA
jgi:hypothetical protein